MVNLLQTRSILLALAVAGVSCAAAADYIDAISFGDAASEQNHGFTQSNSEVTRGGLGEPTRRLLPQHPVSYDGGSIRFTLKVDPERQNYLTVKLWGSDKGADRGRLILYINGLQSGYRHEGDHDVLNQTDDEALFQGRFVYQTVALPPMQTRGKTQVELKIAGLGVMWPYGTSFAQVQRDLTQPTRGIYRAYTHTSTRFEPDTSEKQGDAITPTIRPEGQGEELLTQMKATVNSRLKSLLEEDPGNGNATQDRMVVLAEAYNTPWSAVYHDHRAIAAIIREGDAFVCTGAVSPSDWTGAGPFGEAIARIGANPQLMKALDEAIEAPAELAPSQRHDRKQDPATSPALVKTTRREAWARVLRTSVEGHRTHGRRFYTNQSMIVDYNIYAANRGLRVIDPAQALPDKQALRYLYEAIGLLPWLGNDTRDGGSEKPYGTHYFEITRKGLSRELGYVGTYGETILTFCRNMADLTGDEQVRQQLIKIETARMYFRYPGLDADGYRAMKLTGEIDNRVAHFPVANSAYTIAGVREAWGMEVPACAQDPVSVGAAQQCLEDNQYFCHLAQRAKDKDTLAMMRNIGEYATVKTLPKSAFRLPMTDGQPNFVFSDEEDAVLALKHGQQRLFLNFYYRQEFGVSGVVRILDITPTVMRIATIKSQFEVVSSGQTWSRPDIIDFERIGGFPPPGNPIHQAWQGEKLPIAKRPDDATQPQYGTWGPFVGKAAFYWLRYGDYLFGINTTDTNTYSLPVPPGYTSAPDLVSGTTLDLSKEVKVGPLTTIVLYLGK